MASFSRNEIVLVRYPFADFPGSKVRPAVVVSARHPSRDLFVVPLTSRTALLSLGEYVLSEWSNAGLNVPTAVKNGVYTIHESLIIKVIGVLSGRDASALEGSLRIWFGLDNT